jgi:hypothetical protein
LRSLQNLFFKPIELWVLALVIVLGIVAMVLFGSAVRYTTLGGVLLGPAGNVAVKVAAIPGNIRRLISDPAELNPMLVAEQDRFPGLSGWTTPQTKIQPGTTLGLLLLSRFDGELNNWVVELVDLDQQNVLHRWKGSSDHLFYNKPTIFDPVKIKERGFYHPLLTRDRLLVSTDGNGVTRAVDSCGNLVWNTEAVKPNRLHHSLESDAKGNLWIPSRIFPNMSPEEHQNREFRDDAITKLSPNGKIIFTKSVRQILVDNGYRYLIFGSGDYRHDPIHLNDIQPVDSDGPFWKTGDVFLSLRNQSMVMLYRPSTNRIVWNQQGPWNHQHDVDILNDHQISIFDNNANSTSKGHKVVGYNQVMVYNFETNETTSPYKSALAKNDVRTIGSGRSEIYPNGDVFIEETEYGRLLRVTSEGEVVWQYINRGGDGKINYVHWSRIIQLAHRNEITKILKDLKCG